MRKGQVTLFVVLGLVILIVGGLALFLLSNNENNTNLEIRESDEINLLVKQCLSELSKEGIILSGKYSGRMNIDEMNLQIDPIAATRSDYLYYPPNKLPYWYYVDDSRNVESSFKPPLCGTYPCELNSIGYSSIQEQIQDYVEEKIVDCASLEEYEGRVDIEREMPVVFLDIAEETVIANLYWPHKVSLNGVTDEFSEFVVIHNVKLASAYRLSELVVNDEKNFDRFSSQTISMISLYSGLEEELPPITGIDFTLFGGEKIWISEAVKTRIKKQILPLMELYQIKDSKYYSPYEDESVYAQGIYSSFEIGFGDSLEENEQLVNGLATEFVLPLAEPQISINNGQGVIRGEKLTGAPDLIMMMLGLGVTRYRTTYSVSYPLVFKAIDEEAFNGEGFEFVTAFEVNVKNNLPTNLPFDEYTDISFDESSEGISLFDFDDNSFKVKVINQKDGTGVNDAVVNYLCIEDHFLGRTNMNGEAVGKIPFCELGGVIQVFHPAFSEELINYDHDGTNHEIEVKVWPIETVTVKTSKVNTGSLGYVGVGDDLILEELSDDDFAFVIFEPLDGSWPPIQVVSVGSSDAISEDLKVGYANENVEDIEDFEFPEDYNINITENNEIKLIPGKYLVTAMLLNDRPFTLAERKDCKLLGVAGCAKYPEQTFNNWPTGGLTIEKEFFQNELYGEYELNVIMQEIDKPINWEQMEGGKDKNPVHIWDETRQNNNIARIIFS